MAALPKASSFAAKRSSPTDAGAMHPALRVAELATVGIASEPKECGLAQGAEVHTERAFIKSLQPKGVFSFLRFLDFGGSSTTLDH